MSPSVEFERQRAFRIILQKPLLTSNGPDAENYRLIRAHAQWLKEWFARNAEWNFQLDTEVARLRKTPSDLNDSTRGAVNSKGIAFSRRRYVLLCLALSALVIWQGEPSLPAPGYCFRLRATLGKIRDRQRDPLRPLRHFCFHAKAEANS